MSQGYYGLSAREKRQKARRDARRGRHEGEREHFHLFAVHRHPDWHGHCAVSAGVDSAVISTMHLLRGHDGPALLCARCVADSRDLVDHSCDTWHAHGPFRHVHTPTGRQRP